MRFYPFNRLNLLSAIHAEYKFSLPRKVIVISAQNFRDGGPWTLLNDTISHICSSFPDFLIICIISRPTQHNFSNLVQLIEPFSKSSWLVRLFYEKFLFRLFSSLLSFPIDLWISLHDITSHVVARRQITYYHNPAPFWSPNLLSLYLAPSLVLFKYFYLFVCRLSISRNYLLVVQQHSLANKLSSRLNIHNIAVLPPTLPTPISISPDFSNNQISRSFSSFVDNQSIFFFCPVTPRVFKNIEFAMSVFAELPAVKLVVTISRDQNRYTNYLYKSFSHYSNILFVGYLSSSDMSFFYRNCKAVIFPSLLETWGLPLTEARSFNKDIFAPDLPYVYETLKDYPDFYTYDPYNRHNFLKLLSCYLSHGSIDSACLSNNFKCQNSEFVSFASWKSLIDSVFSS